MKHGHHCPFCYETWLCTDACTIEPDLAEPGLEYGSHCCCPSLACAEEERRQKAEEARLERQRSALRRLASPVEMNAMEWSSRAASISDFHVKNGLDWCLAYWCQKCDAIIAVVRAVRVPGTVTCSCGSRAHYMTVDPDTRIEEIAGSQGTVTISIC